MAKQIVQALIIEDTEPNHELIACLWAALEEVEGFYNADEPRADVQRFYLSPAPPPATIAESVGGNTVNLSPDFGLEVQGTYNRTYDAERVCDVVREMVHREASYLIVTDRDIAPPPELRYVVWAGCRDRGGVVSAAPTNPQYWGATSHGASRTRAAIIKHRVRTAAMSIAGTLLGLTRCENERCFMFAHVDSVTRLDYMVCLGPEHEIPALTLRGYNPQPRRPEEVQPIVAEPVPADSFA